MLQPTMAGRRRPSSVTTAWMSAAMSAVVQPGRSSQGVSAGLASAAVHVQGDHSPTVWDLEEMAQIRDAQLAFIKSHTLRQIAENRVGAAFTAGADQDVKAWMVNMIAGGDKEGYESEAQSTIAFDVRPRLKEIAVPTTIIHGEKDATVPVALADAMAKGFAALPCTSSLARAISPTSRSRKNEPAPRQRARNPRGTCLEAVSALAVPQLDR
jgi:pimeloyl-ACP methyl ester carboxylesterase